MHVRIMFYKVCVEKCPEEALSALSGGYEDAEKQLKPFCDQSVSNTIDWSSKAAIENLIKVGECPAWLLPSTPVLGRCMPGTPPGNV